MVRISALILLFITITSSFAQDLEQIGKKEALKVNGSLSFMNMFYAQHGLAKNRRDPYGWLLSGTVGFNFAGWSVPFSFTLSSQSRTFNQPFNQYGLSPKYKWITLHAGYRNLTFSNYTLNGHTFLGVGAELTPGKWKISGMYGRMLRAIEEDTITGNTGTPSFERWGYGTKVGWEDKGHGLDVNFFKGRDALNSISYVPVQTEISPGENLALGISGKTKFRKLALQAEYGTSAYTDDIRGETIASRSVFGSLNGLFTYRSTTAIYHAYKANISYSIKKVNFGVGYERVDPGYRTMGSYFITGDVENITFNTSTKVLKDKGNVALNLGTQRDNIRNTKAVSTRRLIGSLNLNFSPSKRWSISTSYSNFQTSANTAQRIQQFQNNDTLRFFQVNQNANLTVGYSSGTKEKKNSITFTTGYQVANNNQTQSGNGTTRMLNGNLSFKRSLTTKGLSYGIGINGNNSELSGRTSNAIGPMATLGAAFWKKKIKSSITTVLNHVTTEDAPNSTNWNINMNHNMVLAKRHSFVLTASMINRLTATAASPKYQEYMCTLGYSVGF